MKRWFLMKAKDKLSEFINPKPKIPKFNPRYFNHKIKQIKKSGLPKL